MPTPDPISSPTPATTRFSRILGAPLALWTRIQEQHGRAGAWICALLGILFLACLIYLAKGERPWGPTVEKRLAKGLALQQKEYAVIGLWWVALLNAGLSAALLSTHRWWLPRIADRQGASPTVIRPALTPTSSGMSRGLLITLTLAAVTLAVWERAPRMTQSLWNDEEYAMRRYAHGAWHADKSGEWQFKPAPWLDTLCENENGNNHLLNSLAMRTSLTLWRTFTGATREQFSEVALRTPSLIAGLASLILIVALGVQMRLPLVGIAAAFWLALTPWHLRYSTDAKGYAMMLCFIVLTVWALARALQHDRIRWWVLFAGAEAAFILCFAGSVYIAMALNIIAVGYLLLRRRSHQIFHLLGFNLLAALPVLHWMAPSAPQMIAYLNSPEALRLGMDWPWVRDVLCSLYVGFPHTNPYLADHLGTSWTAIAEQSHRVTVAFSLYAVPMLAGLGLIYACFQSLTARLAVLGISLAGVLAFVHNLAKDNPMVVWYLVYLIIPLALAVPLAIHLISGRGRSPWLTSVLMLVVLVFYYDITRIPNECLRRIDRQPMRQLTQYIHTKAPEALTASFGVSDRQVRSYDPRVNVLESARDLDALIARARAESRPLYVYFCGRHITIQRRPELVARLESPTEFTLDGDFKGQEELFSYKAYRLN